MTAIAVAGGPAQLTSEGDLAFVGDATTSIRYAVSSRRGSSYRVSVAPARLTAVVDETDEGFTARSPELNSLGYGPDPDAALADLTEAVRDYLTFLVEKRPTLAPEVAHHETYLDLLSAPEASWFAAVTIGRAAPDAA